MNRRVWNWVFVFALIAATASAQLQSKGPVKIDTGQVSGALTGAKNDISAYKGIPYAAPPVGPLRWKEPQAAKPWDGVRTATEFGPICPQQRQGQSGASETSTKQSEDCLYLNVWTPAKSASDKLAVMVWIHGGGFTYGSASTAIYDGTHLAEHGVVLVSLNYRLNILSGFGHPLLTKESPNKTSGNYGLLDQIAALQWVRRNVSAFGGDPEKVTIFGESAGGLSVSALVVSPMTKGLFRAAISESGSGSTLTPLASAEKSGQDLVKQMGLENEKDPIATLRTKPWQDLPNAANYRGAPVLDNYAFTMHPQDAWKEGKQHDIPMIIGYNRDEATFFLRGAALPETVDAYKAAIKERYKEKADRVLALYPATTPEEVYWAEINMRTDSGLGVSAPNQLRGMFSVKSKAWFYHFAHLPEARKTSRQGVSHAAELSYVFGTLGAQADADSREVSEAMMGYWTQFAKTGDPNLKGLPEWPAFQKGNEAYLELAKPIHAGKDLKKEKIELMKEAGRR